MRAERRKSLTLRTTPLVAVTGSTAALSCVTPRGSGRAIAALLASNQDPRWFKPLLQAVRLTGAPESANSLGEVVLRRFYPRAQTNRAAMSSHGSALLGDGRLGSVVIIGIPDFGWNILNSFSAVGAGGFVEWNWPSGDPVCDDQVGLFLALEEQADLVDRYGTTANEMLDEINTNACLPSMTSRFKYCVDAFIPDEWIGIFAGDNREHLPDVDPSKSRVQIYINPDAPAGQQCEVRLTGTSMRTPFGVISRKDSAGTFNPITDLRCEVEGSTFKVTGKFRNNFCPTSMLPLCPAIDVELRLSPSASHATGWRSDGLMNPDGFPSFTIKEAVAGHWSIVQKYDATARSFAEALVELAGLLRATRGLPPSCNLY